MDETTKALFDFYKKESKNDFYNAFLYMKFLHQFEAKVMESMGLPVNPEIEKVDPAVDDMLQANLNIIAQAGGNSETDIYHAKIVQLEDAKKLVSLQTDLHIEVPETIVPFKLARNVLLKSNDAIAVGTCPCRLAQAECPCMEYPMEACMFIGDPHASFIADHNPRFRKIEREEAVHILEDCHNRGFVHNAYFKKDMGNRFFAICNCCSCCCGGIKIQNLFTSGAISYSHIAPSGYIATVGEGCIGCGECVPRCQFNAIEMDEKNEIVRIDVNTCMGCGVCETTCPVGAISLQVQPERGGILNIDSLKHMMT
ncbi:MAG: 4Fe-4S binding protein [Desulfobacterales bacterium]